jgi:hypothetical protein
VSDKLGIIRGSHKNVQKAVFWNLKKEYGSGFRYVLYIGHIYEPQH